MRGGKLRHRVQLQAVTVTKSSSGEDIETWAEVASLWANVTPLEARQFYAAEGQHGEISHLVEMRYDARLTRRHRLVHRGRTLEILGVVNIGERDRRIELKCQELV